MLGFLCNRTRMAETASALRGLLGPSLRQADEAMIFFVLPQPELEDGYIEGIVVTGNLAHEARVRVPPVIFNLGVARRRPASKDLRMLNRHPGSILINPANRLNQLTVMEMLRSSDTTARLVAPFEAASRDEMPELLKRGDSFIIVPESGASLRPVLYGQAFTREIKQAIQELPRRLIALVLPQFGVNGGRPVVLRIHLQKGGEGRWLLLRHSRVVWRQSAHIAAGDLIFQSALSAAERVNKFIPRMGICFVDLVFDSGGVPYFMHLGGWDPAFLGRQESPPGATRDLPVDFWDWDLQGDRRRVYSDFASNLLAYTSLVRRGLS